MNIDCQEVNEKLLNELKDLSKSSDEEICGFIVDKNKFINVNNIHPDPKNYFLISPSDYIWGDEIILFHSHPKQIEVNGFSKWDLENQFYFNLKMLLYSVKYDRFYFKEP